MEQFWVAPVSEADKDILPQTSTAEGVNGRKEMEKFFGFSEKDLMERKVS